MPKIEINGAQLYYESTGDGAETVVFAHGLLMSANMFDPQVAALHHGELAGRFRTIAYDHRGQARSSVPHDGYDLDTVAEDAAALIEALGAAPCHFVGLSMGGFVGMRLAARRPELLRSLTLLETAADPEPRKNLPKYKLLNFIARWIGLGAVKSQVMPILFGQKFLTDPARAAECEHWSRHLTSHDKRGITRAVRGVIERRGIEDEITAIETPTLVIVGDQDVATVPAKSERIAERIPHARLVVLPGAGHSASIEEPEAVNRELLGFLASLR